MSTVSLSEGSYDFTQKALQIRDEVASEIKKEARDKCGKIADKNLKSEAAQLATQGFIKFKNRMIANYTDEPWATLATITIDSFRVSYFYSNKNSDASLLEDVKEILSGQEGLSQTS